MIKKAYIFPGQGSQFPGMAKNIYDESAKARELFESACGILGFDITDIMFNGSAEDLQQTKVTQPAVFLHSVIWAMCLEDFNPDMTAGHSLGEFSALAAAGAIGFEDALRLVSIRAQAMQKACEMQPGTMAAVTRLDKEAVEKICSDYKGPGIVIPANYNSNEQIVISGDIEAVEAVCPLMLEAGAKRALKLNVGGAFHSPLMEPAREELAKAIEETPFKTPVCPIYQNVTAAASTDPDVIKKNLLSQLTSPVLWTQTVENMHSDGASEFIEIGPGKVLKGLVAKIIG